MSKDRDSLPNRVNKIIDDYIKPSLSMHGGSIKYIGFEDGVAYIELLGSCNGCPSSQETIKMHIEKMLVEEIEEIEMVMEV
tara:strand:- start:883 stop:1125 length:243 start_codon:yes stop_codon:yes gene_type:complete